MAGQNLLCRGFVKILRKSNSFKRDFNNPKTQPRLNLQILRIHALRQNKNPPNVPRRQHKWKSKSNESTPWQYGNGTSQAMTSAESVASPSMAAVQTVKSPATTVLSSLDNVNTSFTCIPPRTEGWWRADRGRHCIEKWLNTPDSKAQCPMDRQPWGIYSLLRGVCWFY
jgi:hypothetical protein